MKKLLIFLLSITLLLLFAACMGRTAINDIAESIQDHSVTVTKSTNLPISTEIIEKTENPKSSEKSEETQDPINSTEIAVEITATPIPTLNPTPTQNTSTPIPTPFPTDSPADALFSLNLDGVSSYKDLEEHIDNYISNEIDELKTQWKELKAETDTYAKYCKNTNKVSDYYNKIINNTKQMCAVIYEYSAVYARMVLDSGLSAEKQYKAIDGIRECLYDDACDEIRKKIYDGILDDMLDYYYNGIIEEAQDNVNWSEWSEVSSKEYNQHSNAMSRVYSNYSNTSSDIYSFYSDISSKLYSEDFVRAERTYNRFLVKLAKIKGIEYGTSNPNAVFDTSIKTVNSLEELENVVYEQVLECTQALKAEWKALSNEINSFEKYTDRSKDIKKYHKKIEESSYQILVMICEYGVSYADIIMQSDYSERDKYKAFYAFKDCIYDDACNLVKEEIYEDLLMEIKKYYYEGIIYEEKDNVKYSEWSSARSDTYSWWSNARSSVYSDWSDTRGDLYSFYSDIRSELYSGDSEEANEVLQKFKKKVEKMKD